MSKYIAVLLLITITGKVLVESREGSVTECSSGEYNCGDGVCVDTSRLCDGIFDCENGFDEGECGDEYGCEANEFDCQDDVCILTTQVCDRVKDCNDGSDERNCSYTTTAAETTTTTTTTTTTISTTTTSTPVETTEDYSYEYDDCSEDQFTCDDNLCIAKDTLCDGKNDCTFGEDEEEQNCKDNSRSSSIASTTTLSTTTESTTTLISKILTQAEGSCEYENQWYPSGSDIKRTNCSRIECTSGQVTVWKDARCAACRLANPNSVILLTLALVIMLLNVR